MEQLGERKAGLILAAIVVLGLGAGVAIGLVLGWVVAPVRYVDTSISDLAPAHKDEYMVLVASGYALDGNLDHAQARLNELDLPNVGQSLSAIVDRWVAEGHEEGEVRALAALAHDMGVSSPGVLAYVASPTPPPTFTPLPTATPAPTDTPSPEPTATPVPTDLPTEVPTDTPVPTDTAVPPTPVPPTDTSVPPTNTSAPPTNTPKPKPTKTPAPPTNTPKPTNPPVAQWTWSERLVGPGEDAQRCDGSGNLQIRVTVVNAAGAQIPGVWVLDQFSGQYQVTGNVGSPDWGPGETKFEYGRFGGGSLCIAEGQGGACVTSWTRAMPCFAPPPFEDLWAAGYCNCCEPGISRERCQELYNQGAACVNFAHYSWRIVYHRNW